MSSQKEHWNKEYLGRPLKKPRYDAWLEKYKNILDNSGDIPVIDLGCGNGNNSLYLVEHGYGVISCDISEVALERVKMYVPEAQTEAIDMLDGLPFKNENVGVVVADLCLHYFAREDTEWVLAEIKRILKPGGCLLCRVNSTRDINHGAGQGIKIEKNYYDFNGRYKRFFDSDSIEQFFRGWELKYIDEYQMDRLKLPKMLWEVAAVKSTKPSAEH